MRVGVLGPLSVDGAVDELSPRDRTVLSALAVAPGRHVSVDVLADALWGPQPPTSANKVVQGCISRLRRVLGTEAIETSTHGYRLTMPADEVDHARFVRFVAEARDLASRGQFDRASSRAADALRLWRGAPLRELDEWEPARADTARLYELHAQAEELRVDALIQAGRHLEVLADARGLVDEGPTREHRWAMLARAQYLAGRQGQSLDTLQRARRTLIDQLGIEPGPDLRRLEQLILQQDPELHVDESPTAVDSLCPYPGLAAFDIDDADDFFGRDHELAIALLRLRRDGVLVVVGPSGCGKSSLVRAGIAASLRREGVEVCVLRPGTAADWSDAAPKTTGSVLVIDQLEELFGLGGEARDRVLDQMLSHAAHGPLVATLRADRLAELASIPTAARLLRRGLHLLGAMSETELHEAISAPALRAGLLLEPGLAELLVQELAGEPGALPLLSHALQATWMRREGRTLTVDAYRESGGVRRAINTSAEAVFDELDDAEQHALRSIALRLVTPGDDGEPSRCRVAWGTVAPDPLRRRLVERLVQSRLLTTEDDAVTLAHEAVVRAWPRLRSWLEEDAESHRVLGHLASRAATWDAMERPDAELYRGPRLVSAQEWREREAPDLTAVEQEFLDASLELADAERAAIAERLEVNIRSNRKLRSVLLVVTFALVAAATAGAIAVDQADRADHSARSADAARVGALALSVPDLDHSLLLAVESLRTDESEQTRGSVMTTLGRAPEVIGSKVLPGPAVAIATSPDGRIIATGGPLDGLGLYDAESLDDLGTASQPVASVAFSPASDLVAVGTNRYSPTVGEVVDFEPGLVLYDVATVDPHGRQPLLPRADVEVPFVQFSDDGRLLAAVTRQDPGGSRLLVWDADEMAAPTMDRPVDGEPFRFALSPDGSIAYVVVIDRAGRANTLALSLLDGRELGRIDAGGDGIAMSDDGTLLALTDSSRPSTTSVVLVDTGSLHEVGRLTRTGSTVAALAFAPGGRLLAVADRSSTAAVWDVDRGEVTHVLTGHSGSIWDLDFTDGDKRLVTTGLGHRLLVWDLVGHDRAIERIDLGLRSDSVAVVVGAAGRFAVSATETALEFADIVDPDASSVLVPYPGELQILAWDPIDPSRLFTGGRDGLIGVWDASSGTLTSEHRISSEMITALDPLPDGSRVVYGTESGAVGILDIAADQASTLVDSLGGQIVGVALREASVIAVTSRSEAVVVDLEHPDDATRVPLGFIPVRSALSPDGERLAIVGVGGETGLLGVHSGTWIHEPVTLHDDAAFSAAFSPDGTTLVTGGLDGRFVIWNGINGSATAVMRPGAAPATVVPVLLDDGTTIVVGSTEGAAYRWTTDSPSLIEQACAIARRDLTTTEWKDALGDRPWRPTCS